MAIRPKTVREYIGHIGLILFGAAMAASVAVAGFDYLKGRGLLSKEPGKEVSADPEAMLREQIAAVSTSLTALSESIKAGVIRVSVEPSVASGTKTMPLEIEVEPKLVVKPSPLNMTVTLRPDVKVEPLTAIPKITLEPDVEVEPLTAKPTITLKPDVNVEPVVVKAAIAMFGLESVCKVHEYGELRFVQGSSKLIVSRLVSSFNNEPALAGIIGGLDELRALLADADRRKTIFVEGYASAEGPATVNLNLAEERAETVAERLRKPTDDRLRFAPIVHGEQHGSPVPIHVNVEDRRVVVRTCADSALGAAS